MLCIKHIGFEGPGAIAQWAQQNGHELDIAPLYHDHHLPSPEGYDAILIMGGPMNVYEEDKYPWLAKEKSYIRGAIASGKHVLGVCLGAQLIAVSMGAKITANENKEIGWFPINRTEDCPTTFSMPKTLKVFHWHGDTFEIPQGAHRIASSDACFNQGFVHHSKVLALQCHLEMTPESLTLLATSCSNELVHAPYIQNMERLQREPAETYQLMHQALYALLDAWARK